MPRGSGRSRGGTAGKSSRHGVEFVAQAEPVFLQRLKARAGYRDDTTKLTDKFGDTYLV